MNENYRDQDGTPCTLEWLVRHEPEWAASRIRIERSERELLTAEVERLRAFEAAVVAYAAATQVIRADDVGDYDAAWRDLCQADDAMLALVPKGPTP